MFNCWTEGLYQSWPGPNSSLLVNSLVLLYVVCTGITLLTLFDSEWIKTEHASKQFSFLPLLLQQAGSSLNTEYHSLISSASALLEHASLLYPSLQLDSNIGTHTHWCCCWYCFPVTLGLLVHVPTSLVLHCTATETAFGFGISCLFFLVP